MVVTLEMYGSERRDHLATMLNVAVTLTEQGEEAEAEDLIKDLLRIQSRVSGLDHSLTQDAKKQLASLYRVQGRLKEAEKLMNEVMEARISAFGIEHRGTLTSMSDLASILMDQGRVLEAEKLLL